MESRFRNGVQAASFCCSQLLEAWFVSGLPLTGDHPIQALARAKEGNDRYDKIMSAFADYRAAIAADIAIVKTLAETNTAALASAEHRLAAAIEQMNTRFGELNQRIDRLLDGREA